MLGIWLALVIHFIIRDRLLNNIDRVQIAYETNLFKQAMKCFGLLIATFVIWLSNYAALKPEIEEQLE